MKKLLVVAAVSLVLAVQAEPVHRHEAGAGQTITIGYGAGAQDPGYSSPQAAQLSCYYDLHDGGTLRYYDAQGRTSTIWNPIVATNGLAVLDITGWPQKTDISLNGGIYTAGGKGYLRIKGYNGQDLYVGSSTSDGYAYTTVTDVRRIELVDDTDQPINHIIYYRAANLTGVVTNNSWRMTANTMHRLMGDAAVLPEAAYTTTDTALYIGSDAAVGADQTLTVNNTLGFWPIETVCDPDLGDGLCRPFAAVTRTGARLTVGCSVVLQAGAKMSLANSSAKVTFNGTVSGAGSVSIGAGHTDDVFGGTVSVPVQAASGVLLSLGDGASLARFEPADATVGIKVLTGTASLADLTGTVTLSGEGKAASFLNVTGAPEGATIIEDATATVLFDGSATPVGNVLIRALPDGRREIRFGKDASQLPALATPYEAYELGNGAVFENVPANVNLRANEGVTATVRTDGTEGDSVSLSLRGGTVALGTSPAYWFDFSRTNTLRRIGEGTTTDYLDRDFIERCVDWRQPDADRSLWNRRCYGTTFDYVDSVMPIPVWNGLNGKTYLSMGEVGRRRLPFSDGQGYNTFVALPAQMVIMVYGATNGGGWSMVAADSSALTRPGATLDDPIAPNDDYPVWLNGESVKPSEAKFVNGWQVISIQMNGLGFRGLGFKNVLGVTTDFGGQDYAEVLVFTNAVSERVRCEVETYLAKKWGISGYSATAMAQVEAAKTTVIAEGAGTVEATGAGTLELGGNFAGTVRLNGGALTVKDAPLPYTEETLPSENCVGWYDPDDSATMRRVRDLDLSVTTYDPDGMRLLYDRFNPNPASGDSVVVGVGSRMPKVRELARGYGETRNWMDFDGTEDPTTPVSKSGNSLRIAAYNPNTKYATIDGALAVKNTTIGTGFVVIDSSRPTFTPVISVVAGDSGDIRSRTTFGTGAAIWQGSTADKVKSGETRLNGVAVDQTKGYTGCPEVLAFRPTAAATAAVFGAYKDTEGKITHDEALLMGEAILYSTKLSDEDTARIEGYLMRKWFGILPPTCVDPRAATVAGFGTVKVDDIAKLPRFDAAFAGEVSVAAGAASGSFNVTINPETGEVVGGLVTPEATVTLPAACTLTVDFSPSPEALAGKRGWTVFDCKDYAAPVEWTLAFANPSLAAKFKFVRKGNAIQVKPQNGLMLILR